MMIRINQKGDFSNTKKYLGKISNISKNIDLDKYGKEGVEALSLATPVDSGLTANSWFYEIVRKNESFELIFKNRNIQNGVSIAIILQYGHATRNGGWVQGRDYINPAIQPIFDRIAKEAWKEVSTL